MKIPELVLHRQSDPGAICSLMKDQEIAEQACAITDRATGLITPYPD